MTGPQADVAPAQAARPTEWDAARAAVHAAGAAASLPATEVPVGHAALGATLAAPLRALTDLPAFPTSSVDGYAVRGPGPWRVTGRVLAGQVPDPVAPGTAVEIATGAMVPDGTDHVIRVEEVIRGEEAGPAGAGTVTGTPRTRREWREIGEEARRGEELLPAGSPVSAGVVGLAATCGYDQLLVRRAPRVAVVVFGDELAASGLPGAGRVRDSLGPTLPAYLERLGATPVPDFAPRGPVADTLTDHIAAITDALADADIVCTTGGTMHGPVDHLHPALAALGAQYVVNTVRVRPGFPMLVARLPGPKWVAGLPGNPQSAVVALVSLVAPLIAGLVGRPVPALRPVRVGAAVPGRGGDTHLALARVEADGLAYPVPHAGSAMLRGVARADGFVVVRPGADLDVGGEADLLPIPMLIGERP